jgi:hypothetical protein
MANKRTYIYYAVTYTLDEGSEYRMQCMVTEGETTTDDIPKMIGARIWGTANEDVRRISVKKFVETSRVVGETPNRGD